MIRQQSNGERERENVGCLSAFGCGVLVSSVQFAPFNCLIVALSHEEGVYPENPHVAFCYVK